MKKRKKIRGFFLGGGGGAEMDFQRLADLEMCVDQKYDVLCLCVFVYGIPV